MLLTEIVKNFLQQPKDTSAKDSSIVHHDNVLTDLSGDDYSVISSAFFDSESNSSIFGGLDLSDIIGKQRDKILKYRQIAMYPDVNGAIDEIVNELIFSYDDHTPLKLDIDIDNTRLVEAISEKWDKIVRLTNIKKNIFPIVKRGYIDGKIVFHCAYEKNKTINGIKTIKMIEPTMLYFDPKDKCYKYMQENSHITFGNKNDQKYSIEEIVMEDFGLTGDGVNLGYLEYAIKPANMLKTLEDLLIPLRFSRSISRRVFNIDIGDLPNKRGQEVMNSYQSKFKYKKFYNNETGEVTNQQHITSMVEDYWFANRSGGRGTTVDVLDESGNLGELGDILYAAKKLYKTMKIPSNRIDINPEGDKDYEYDSTRVSKEDMNFFMYITRLRQVYSSLFKEILKREVVSTKTMSEKEWDDNEDSIRITFINENKFIEKMKLDVFLQKLDIYERAQEHQGKIFSVEDLMSDIFRMSNDEFTERLKKIEKEKKNPLFKQFYQVQEDNF